MKQEHLVLAIAAGELLLLLWIIVAWALERAALARLVSSAHDPERLKSVALRLPSTHRAAASQFAGELARKGPLDETVVGAVVRATSASYGLPLAVSTLLRVLVALSTIAPLVRALLTTAEQIQRALPSDAPPQPARAFLEAQEALAPAFSELQRAAQSSALLTAGMVLVGAVGWLLRRAEVREARFVHALLRAAMAARPSAPAPIAGRLSELLAPERSLRMPVAAALFFFVSVGVGWIFLVVTASVREANAADIYDVWPEDSIAPRTGPVRMKIPVVTGGGRAIKKDANSPTLAMSADSVEISSTLIVRLTDEHLPPGWQARVEGLSNALKAFARSSEGLEIVVLAQESLTVGTFAEVLKYLHDNQSVSRVDAIVERRIRPQSVGGGLKVHAALPIRIGAKTGSAPEIGLRIGLDTVTVSAGSTPARIDLGKKGWRDDLARAMRKKLREGSSAEAQPEVVVTFDQADQNHDITYETFAKVLSAADSTCTSGAVDCGLPGLGLVFRLPL